MISHKMFGLLLLFVCLTLFNINSTQYMIKHTKEPKYTTIMAVLWCMETYILYGTIVYFAMVE
jgi:hypothetical protein